MSNLLEKEMPLLSSLFPNLDLAKFIKFCDGQMEVENKLTKNSKIENNEIITDNLADQSNSYGNSLTFIENIVETQRARWASIPRPAVPKTLVTVTLPRSSRIVMR